MIQQIKNRLQKSYDNAYRKCRIDRLVTDLASTIYAAYDLEDNTSIYITDSFIESIEKVIGEYSHQILDYNEPKPVNK